MPPNAESFDTFVVAKQSTTDPKTIPSREPDRASSEIASEKPIIDKDYLKTGTAIQGDFFTDALTENLATPPSPSDQIPIDQIEYHEIVLANIYEHPQVRGALQAMKIASVWSFPEKYFSGDGIRELLFDSPLHATKLKGEYQCFRGFVFLKPATRVLPLTARIPVLVHTRVGPDEVYKAVYAELVLKPLWYRLDFGESKRLTEIVVRLQDPRVASLLLAKTKCAIAMLVKRSLSALRKKKAQNV